MISRARCCPSTAMARRARLFVATDERSTLMPEVPTAARGRAAQLQILFLVRDIRPAQPSCADHGADVGGDRPCPGRPGRGPAFQRNGDPRDARLLAGALCTVCAGRDRALGADRAGFRCDGGLRWVEAARGPSLIPRSATRATEPRRLMLAVNRFMPQNPASSLDVNGC